MNKKEACPHGYASKFMNKIFIEIICRVEWRKSRKTYLLLQIMVVCKIRLILQDTSYRSGCRCPWLAC